MTQLQSASPNPKTVAIIGSGVSGLVCAHYLVASHKVTIFEANDYLGGHVNTIDVALKTPRKLKKDEIETAAIDTGFIVFNERTYPNFFRLLDELDVPFQKTDMSFSVKNPAINFEYNGHTLNSLVSQRKNLISPKFWRFAKDIIAFNKHIKQRHQAYKALRQAIDQLTLAVEQLNAQNKLTKRKAQRLQEQLANKNKALETLSQETLGDYLSEQKYSQLFQQNYLLPMVSAIWSMQIERSKSFPLIFFAQFFDNHGLLDIINRPQWFTIKGGSKQYVNKLIERYANLGGNALVNSPVQSITRQTHGNKTDGHKNSITIHYKDAKGVSKSASFDEVIVACHADVAKRLLADINEQESQILGAFSFTDNEAILHTDTSVLPKKPLAWASWNYLLPSTNQQLQHSQAPASQSLGDNHSLHSELNGLDELKPVLTYHMNILQRLDKHHNYLVTLNEQIDTAQVIKRIDYRHPVYDIKMTLAQKQWHRLASQDNHTHFCGAYWFSGFHEDGVRSGLRVCQHLGVNIELLDAINPAHLDKVIEPNPTFNNSVLPIKADKNQTKLSQRQLISASTNTSLNEVFQ